MQEYTVKVASNGNQSWYQDSELHRIDGPAVTYDNGDQCWYQNGQRHRTDGPAAIWADGSQCWYQNGALHRTDGPAAIWASGDQYWYLDGVEVTQEEHARRTSPAKELTVAEIEKLLGYSVKVIK